MKVFLTGATGLLGGELLVTLVARADIERIHVLVRSRSGDPSMARLRAIFAIHGDAFDAERIVPVEGDLLDPALAQRLAAAGLDEVDVVVHAAANTSFLRMNDTLVDRTNVDAIDRLLDWAQRLSRLATFAYVGTAMICGASPRAGFVGEDESPSPAAEHIVPYTRSKAVAEQRLRARVPSHQLLIVRPSIIMGDARPVVPRSPVVLWAMAALNQLRLLPVEPDAPLDIIPVDHAARAIVALLFAPRAHAAYHISAGGHAATSARQLAAALQRQFVEPPPFHFVARALLPDIRRWARGQPLSAASELCAHRTYLDHWTRSFRDLRRLRAVLIAIEPYLRFMDLGHIFDDARLRAATGLSSPEPAHVYMARAMHHLAAIDVVGGAADP